MKVQRLMVIVAHPAAGSFPSGGTIAKTAAEGGEVLLVTATRSEAGISGLSPEETGRLREHELRAACEVLGVSALRFLDYVDGTLDRVEANSARRDLVDVLIWKAPPVDKARLSSGQARQRRRQMSPRRPDVCHWHNIGLKGKLHSAS